MGFPELGDMQNATVTIFRLDNGGTATLRMDYFRPQSASGHGDDRLRLAGTKGIVEYREDAGVVVLGPQGSRTVEALPRQGSVFADFVESAYAGAPAALPWRDILRANEWTLAAQEAADAGTVIRRNR